MDIFDNVKNWAGNVCPPEITTERDQLYERIAQQDVLLHVALKQRSITQPDELYRYLVEWQDRISEDKTLPGAYNVGYWNRAGGEWISYSQSVKILALVALLSAFFGLIKGKLKFFGLWRLIVILSILVAAYTYCIAKYLYAEKQVAYACLSALEARYDLEPDTDWSALLQQRLTKIEGSNDVLTQQFTSTRRPWWHIEVGHSILSTDLARILVDDTRSERYFKALLSQDQIDALRHRLQNNTSPEASPLGNGSRGGKSVTTN